jgi:hypothetical protein
VFDDVTIRVSDRASSERFYETMVRRCRRAAVSTILWIRVAPGDRAEQFYGDRSQARRGASLTSRRRIGSIEKAPFPGLFYFGA